MTEPTKVVLSTSPTKTDGSRRAEREPAGVVEAGDERSRRLAGYSEHSAPAVPPAASLTSRVPPGSVITSAAFGMEPDGKSSMRLGCGRRTAGACCRKRIDGIARRCAPTDRLRCP